MTLEQKARVGVVGATGYGGQELIRLLLGHPAVELTYIAGNHDVSEPLSSEFQHFLGRTSLYAQKYSMNHCLDACDLVFVSLPAGASGSIAQDLWRAGKRVIDLSGDLRLPGSLYQQWYGLEPLSDEVLGHAVYGLSEWNATSLASATLVANPGCYATAVLLALLPIVKAGLTSPATPIVVDAKSGISGAGRAAKQQMQFAEMAENFYAYKVGHHQHIPEIEYQLNRTCMQKVSMSTHLLPIIRGIFISIYVPLPSLHTIDSIYQLYESSYEASAFVHVLPNGQVPQLKSLRGTNDCHIGLFVDERTNMLQIFSTIDNLQKGAAGQAVQNMNLMFCIPEETGLNAIALVP